MNTFIYNQSYEDYDRIQALRSGDLIKFMKSPYNYIKSLEVENKPTLAMNLGVQAHTMILEPERFKKEYILLDEEIDKRTKKYKELETQYEGMTLIPKKDADVLNGIYNSIQGTSHVKAVMDTLIHTEVTGVVRNDASGLNLKCRYDGITVDGCIVEFKTTQNASFDSFSRTMANLYYHVRAGMYYDMYHIISGKKPKDFIFVVAETNYPYEVAVYRLGFASLSEGISTYNNMVNRFLECESNKNFPKMQDKIQEIDLPNWAFTEI